MHLGTCHQNSRALTCFMSLATFTLAQNKAAEVKAALPQNQAKIRSCQQQARRQAKFFPQGGLSCAAVRRVLAVYAVSEWDLGLAVQAAQRLSLWLHLMQDCPRQSLCGHSSQSMTWTICCSYLMMAMHFGYLRGSLLLSSFANMICSDG